MNTSMEQHQHCVISNKILNYSIKYWNPFTHVVIAVPIQYYILYIFIALLTFV